MNTYKMVLNEDTRVLIYGNSIKVVRIRIDEINYISCANRIIMIHTNNASDGFYGKMKDVYNLLGKYGFEYINESEIVNCMNVSSMTVNSIILREGTELICSKNSNKSSEILCGTKFIPKLKVNSCRVL